MPVDAYPMPLPSAYPRAPVKRVVRSSSADFWGRLFIALVITLWALAFIIGFQASLTLLTLASFGAAILGIRYPIPGLLGIGMLCTLDALTRVFLLQGGIWRWNTLNYWLLFVIVASLADLVKLKDTQTRLAQLFILLLVIQLMISQEWVNGIQHLLNITALFGLIVYFTRVRHDKHVWYWLGLVNGTLGAVGSLVFYLQKSHLPYINPNALAFFSLTAIFAICLGFHFAEKRRMGQPVLVILAAINYVWIFLSGSRGDLLIATFCMLFLTLSGRGHLKRSAYIAIALLMGIALSNQFGDLQANTLHRLDKLFDKQASAVSRTSGRSDLALGGWYIFLQHPLGVGTGSFAPEWARLNNPEGLSGFRKGQEVAAHSGWIKILAENGIPGILLLAGFVLSFSLSGWRRRAQGLLLPGLLVTAVLGVAFLSTEFQAKGLWFLAAGVITLLSARDPAKRLSRGLSKVGLRARTKRLRLIPNANRV